MSAVKLWRTAHFVRNLHYAASCLMSIFSLEIDVPLNDVVIRLLHKSCVDSRQLAQLLRDAKPQRLTSCMHPSHAANV